MARPAIRNLSVKAESWPIAGNFTISRGSKTEADVVVVEISSHEGRGRGECVPYARYGETTENVIAAIEAQASIIANVLDRQTLLGTMPAGAARNAIDCALIDYAAKLFRQPAWKLLNLPEPGPVQTAFTISLDTPEKMAVATARAADRPLLKIKLGGDGDAGRIEAVRNAAPKARLVVDANEAWSPDNFETLMQACANAGVELIEQPLPADNDMALAHLPRLVPICADESVHDLASLKGLVGKYDAINIKLDKTGGLTSALMLADAAQKSGFKIMVGCMVATSLAMAPAIYLASMADYIDLDGPLLLARDRQPGLTYNASTILPPAPDLWG